MLVAHSRIRVFPENWRRTSIRIIYTVYTMANESFSVIIRNTFAVPVYLREIFYDDLILQIVFYREAGCSAFSAAKQNTIIKEEERFMLTLHILKIFLSTAWLCTKIIFGNGVLQGRARANSHVINVTEFSVQFNRE